MKKTTKICLALPVLLAFLASGCSVDDPDHPTGLEAPPMFSSYVAIGNSLTAGFMDSGLMMPGQATSYPALIAGQLGLAADFSQPWVTTPGIGSSRSSDPSTMVAGVLYWNGSAPAILGETPLDDIATLLPAAAQPLPYNNLGVPGATLWDMLNAYSRSTCEDCGSGPQDKNIPFFDFINRATLLYGNEARSATVLELDGVTPKAVDYNTASTGWQAIAKGPALLTVWAGNNDVLGGATGGNPTTDNLTDPNVFASRYSDLLQVLAGGLFQRTGFPATIVVANIPSVTDVAYFIDEPTFNLALANLSGGQLNAWPGGYEEGAPDLLTFTVLSWVQANIGDPSTPIPSNYTLTAAETGLVAAYIDGYNQAIAMVAAAVNATPYASVGVADMNAALAALPAPAKTHFMLLLPQVGGDIATAAATTQFSLDGVHPNNHGYAITANAFIAAINTLTEAEIADVDPTAITWDPTYGVPIDGKASAVFSLEAAEHMTAVFR